MKLVNHTAWPHLMFERRDTHNRAFVVLVLQGTFGIEDGKPLRALPEQEPVLVGDRYRGDPARTSPRRSGATATFKPSSDIHVDAIARSPEGKPRKEWPVRIRVGRLTRDMMVRGPHDWVHAPMLGWGKTGIEPCTEVPLEYERAFGGSFRVDGKLVEEPRNPVGTGYLPRGIDTSKPVAAPQVVALDERSHLPGRIYTPRGCGPIPSYFAPRRDRLGTIDARWVEKKWPCVPDDFDYAHYQSAHPDFVYPGLLQGDEPVQLVHVAGGGRSILTALPGWVVWTLLRLESGRLVACPARLDTVHFDVTDESLRKNRVYLTWRSVFPLDMHIRQVETRMGRANEEARATVA